MTQLLWTRLDGVGVSSCRYVTCMVSLIILIIHLHQIAHTFPLIVLSCPLGVWLMQILMTK